MAKAFTPGLQLKSRAVVRKIRELPVKGEIPVSVGQQVSASETVGRAFIPGELHIVRIAEKLGIEPFEVIRGIKVKTGQRVRVGDILCEHAGFFGLFKVRFPAPAAGEVEYVNEATGHVGIRSEARPVSVDAYISGKVTAIESCKAVSIETQAAFAQGIFGVGGERRGELKKLHVAAGQKITAEDIPADIEGKVLFGGTHPSLEAVKKAAGGGAVGLIVGGIDDQALAGYLGYDLGIALTGDEDVLMTIIVTEGFGAMPMSGRFLDMLSMFEGKPASINGATQVRAGALRPEIIVSSCDAELPAEVRGESLADEGLAVGRTVRIIRVPYFGALATVTGLPHEARQIETGAMARVLEARLQDGTDVVVPRANVELM